MHWITALVVLSVFTFVASLILIPWLVVKLPPDYFAGKKRHASKLRRYHPAVYFLIRVLKNLLGIALIAAGLVMLLMPVLHYLTLTTTTWVMHRI